MAHDNPKYPWLRSPWTSALATGNAMSALLRGWQLFDDDRYRAAAGVAYDALHEPRTGIAIFDGDELWYEEYPGDPPLHVLNGHIYALLGVVDIDEQHSIASSGMPLKEIARIQWRQTFALR